MTDLDLPTLDLAPSPSLPRPPGQVQRGGHMPPAPTRPYLPAQRGGGPSAAAPHGRVRVSVEVDCFHNLTLFRGVVSGIGADTVYLMAHRKLTAGELLRIVLPCPDGQHGSRVLLTCRIHTVETAIPHGPLGMNLDVLRVEGELEPGLYQRYLCSLGVDTER